MPRYEVKRNERGDQVKLGDIALEFPWRVVDTKRRMTIGMLSNAFTAQLLANRLNLGNLETSGGEEA